MSKRGFQAGHWFGTANDQSETFNKQNKTDTPSQPTTVPEKVREALKPFIPKEDTHSDEGFKKYFIPGWTGAALISREAKEFVKILDQVHHDCKLQFFSLKSLNRKSKIAIYNEFISYAEYKTINCTELDNYQAFWKAIQNKETKYKNILANFIDIYSFRVSVIFLLKSRFISVLMDELDLKFDIKNFLYSTSFLTNLFKQGSKSELKASLFK